MYLAKLYYIYVYIVIRVYYSLNLYIVYDFVVGCEMNLLKNVIIQVTK